MSFEEAMAVSRKWRMEYRRPQKETPERREETKATGELAGLAEVASSSAADTVWKAMLTAKEVLDADVVFVSKFIEDRLVFYALEGDAESFGWREGQGLSLGHTFCKRMIEGQVPNVVHDAKNDERVSDLDVTWDADIGSYVGLPLRFSNGQIFGTLCCLSHSPDPSLRECDAQFMSVLTRLIAEQLEREEAITEKQPLGIRAAGLHALHIVLKAQGGYTSSHSQAVADLSVAVAHRMRLPVDKVAWVEQAALLHDIGKIGISDVILNKREPLDDAEREAIKEHTIIGERIVCSTEDHAKLAVIIRAAHERWDGTGYPDGLSGEQIPLASRIILACDAYHAMTSDRPYRRAISKQVALEELRRQVGTQFCPYTIEALLDVFDQGTA